MSVAISALHSPVFIPSLERRYGIDAFSSNTYSAEVRPRLVSFGDALARALRYAKEHGLQAGKLSARGNHFIKTAMEAGSHLHLAGPRSYTMVSHLNGNRGLRSDLERVGHLKCYRPSIDSEGGNVINPNMLIDTSWEEISAYCRAKAALMAEDLRPAYATFIRDIFAVDDLYRIESSLSSIEISWDIASSDPRGLIRSFVYAASMNLSAVPINQKKVPVAAEVAISPVAPPPADRIIGFSPRFKFVAYPKLAAVDDQLGVARFEFRFEKTAIFKVLGSQVLPPDSSGIERVFAEIAAHAWPYLTAMDRDRLAPAHTLTTRTMLRVLGGARNQIFVADFIDQLIRDGKIRVDSRNRPLVKRLEAAGWLERLLFQKPAYRKLAPGINLRLFAATEI